MATQFLENFWAYGAGGQAHLLEGFYADTGGGQIVADPDPTATGNVYLLGPNNGQAVMLRRVLSGLQGTVGFAARYWLPTLPPDTSRRPLFVDFHDVNNGGLCYVTCDPSGYLQAWNWNRGAPLLIGQSAAPVIVAAAWRHIESKATFANGTGTAEIRVEGVTELNIAGVVTSPDSLLCQNAGPGYLRSVGTIGPPLYIKDVACWDGSGAVDNTFFGPSQIYTLLTDSDVSLNWTPSSGLTGFNLIDRSPPPDDADYISAPSPTPAPAKFTLSNLPANVTSVLSVMVVNRSRKTDGGDGSLQAGLISGGSTGLGVNRAIATSYNYWGDVYDTDPNGGINWSPVAVNALELQLNRTA